MFSRVKKGSIMAKKKTSKRVQRRSIPSVDRRIMFYRINCGNANNGQPILFNARHSLSCIDGLAWSANGRYMETRDGDVTCSWIDSAQTPGQMRLATVRRIGLPLIENGGGDFIRVGYTTKFWSCGNYSTHVFSK